ncbi:MAG: hypothetical protein BWY42_00667 [Candidatus Omnitrophica bacterium ADurb.Bin277]|nr:MAG: hypothetical protein BWY42_00667 [Candidatus Omnitrophica bacterium ADurb.Bin277]
MKKYLAGVVVVLSLVLPVPGIASEKPAINRQKTGLYKDVFDQGVYYEGVNQLDLGRWGRKIFGKKIPSANVNIFDEVPDSSFFTNRHARRKLSPAELERGCSETPGPDLSGPMTVIKGKQEGLHPGFFIKDAKGDSYLLKFDAEGYLGLATGAEVVASRFYHAIGYNVPQYTIFRFRPEDIVAGENAYTYDDTGFKKKMTPELLEQYLSFLPITEEGEYLASASKILPGKNKGYFSFRSRRKNDPDDPVNHRDRREIRALAIFSAWLNNNDIRESNTLDMAVTDENGRTTLKHYLIDFNSALGAAKGGPKPPMFGHEYMLDYGEVAKAFISLGLWEKPWQERWREAEEEVSHESPAVGYFDNNNFDPDDHKAQLPYEVFRILTSADGFWAAKIMASFSEDDIRAMVKAGQYDKEDEDYLTGVLTERRDMIIRHWFSEAAPLDNFEYHDGLLKFSDLAVDRAFEKKETAVYVADLFSYKKGWKKISTIESGESFFNLDPALVSSSTKTKLEIRVKRNGDEAEGRYVKVILGPDGIQKIQRED